MASAPKLLGYLSINSQNTVSAAAAIAPIGLNESPAEETAAAEPAPIETCAWTDLVRRVQKDEPEALEELYGIFHSGIRFFLCRQLGPECLDDNVHDAFLVVVESIRSGELREPSRLMGYVRTVVRRMVAAHIDKQVHNRKERADLDFGTRVADSRSNPEQEAIFRQKVDLVRRVLAQMPERDREILYRFYVDEQTQQQICEEMQLTMTQFRLLKYRAKAKFGEIGKKKLQSGIRSQLLMRISGM